MLKMNQTNEKPFQYIIMGKSKKQPAPKGFTDSLIAIDNNAAHPEKHE
jgi:hypothetical protein